MPRPPRQPGETVQELAVGAAVPAGATLYMPNGGTLTYKTANGFPLKVKLDPWQPFRVSAERLVAASGPVYIGVTARRSIVRGLPKGARMHLVPSDTQDFAYTITLFKVLKGGVIRVKLVGGSIVTRTVRDGEYVNLPVRRLFTTGTTARGFNNAFLDYGVAWQLEVPYGEPSDDDDESPDYSPSLDFSDARNSQYIPLL